MKRLIQLLTGGALLAAFFVLSPSANTLHAAPPPRNKVGHVVVSQTGHTRLECEDGSPFCTEVTDAIGYGGAYTGHDEPSVLFYSNKKGSGNAMSYNLTLPKDPPTAPVQMGGGGTDTFMLHPAFWFGMAMCDDQSFPEYNTTVGSCKRDSDTNIFNNSNPNAADSIRKHPGTAFMEMQFYPPGWVMWPAGDSCDSTKWCAALNIDSLAEDPANGLYNNSACEEAAGDEYVNFAFLTKNGTPHAPASPLLATLATYTPDPNTDFFMNSGDDLRVSLFDTKRGLRVLVDDLTTGKSGSMTASAENQFGEVKWDPNGSDCAVGTHNIPTNFHPMYSTSSEDTRVPWAAHTYNISFADETGHFDYCNDPTVSGGACATTEGDGSENADEDDTFCFDKTDSSLFAVSGCQGTNFGFDGVAYQDTWPGTYVNHAQDKALHPTSFLFSSPKFRQTRLDPFALNYARVAFEADLPRIEAADSGGPCDRTTGIGCTSIPQTDDGNPAVFYPIFSTGMHNNQCVWRLGGTHIPGTTNLFGGSAASEYGPLLQYFIEAFGGGGTTATRYNNFRRVLNNNPCPA